ncbi:MAG: sortase [Patescibacteria group bacterium]
MSYIYVKKTPKVAHPKQRRKYFAVIFFAVGSLIFLSAVFPIIRFQLEYSQKFNQVVNPLSTRYYNRNGNILGDLTTDYTQISNWFVTDGQNPTIESSGPLDSPTTYLLSIPKLKIKDALVDVGSMDLKKSLIQYPQTALPGQLGNSVVFGHSVLPQFFNPKSYLTIFSTLYRLEPGDEIIIDYDNVTYKYLVEEMFEVQPTDLSVLEQRFDDRYLTLITCSPPGTYLRRLVIKSKIVDL